MDERFIGMAERIAALEEKAEAGASERARMERKIDGIAEAQEKEKEVLASLINKISKWEGKFGGVIFIIGCLWAFLTGLPGAIIDWIKAFGGVK